MLGEGGEEEMESGLFELRYTRVCGSCLRQEREVCNNGALSKGVLNRFNRKMEQCPIQI